MLPLSQIFTYAAALGVAAAIPGPGVAALVARSVSQGAGTAFCMLGGLILGDLTFLSFAVFGLALLAQGQAQVFSVIKWGACLYLLYLAWQFWHAGQTAFEQAESRRGRWSAALSGLTLTLGNPKTIAFYLALLPLVVDVRQISLDVFAWQLVPLTVAILFAVLGVFILGATVLRRSLSAPGAQRLLFRGAALTMVLAAGSMLLRG